MKIRYKIKFKNGKVVGPLVARQVGVLFINGHLEGQEEYQIIGNNNWNTVVDYPELFDLIHGIINGTISEESISSKEEKEVLQKLHTETGVKELTSLEKKVDKTKKIFQEFQFNKGQIKSYRENILQEDENTELEKTVVKRGITPEVVVSDKTVVAKVQIPHEHTDDNATEENLGISEKEEVPIQQSVDVNDKTEVHNVEKLIPELKKELDEVEKEFAQQLSPVEYHEEEVDEDKFQLTNILQKLPAGKKKKWITLLAFLVVFYVLLFPDNNTSEKIKIVYPKINFPIAKKFFNRPKAVENYRLGKAEHQNGKYINKIRAAQFFYRSLQNMFYEQKDVSVEEIKNKKKSKKKDLVKSNKMVKENLSPAIFWLIMTYAELLPNIKTKNHAASVILRLINIVNTKLITDERAALGAGIFYSNIGRFKTASYIFERYILYTISDKKKGKLSKKLLSYRLHAFTKAGLIGVDRRTGRDDAEETFQYLNKMKHGPLEMYLYCAEYLELNQKFIEAEKMLFRASKYYKQSVPLILKYTEYALRNNNLKQLVNNVKALELLKVESSPVYFAKYLEFKGIALIAQKQHQKAMKYLYKSLKLNDSDELRSRLAELEITGSDFSKYLILESKIKYLLKYSKNKASQNKWEDAFKYAVEAVDASPYYIPSHLWLAKIQLKKGYFMHAIDILNGLKQKYPQSEKINLSLIETYIEANLITEAMQRLNLISLKKSSKNSSRFYSLLGRAYIKNNRMGIGIKYIKRGLALNSLNAEDEFYLSQLYYKYGKIKRSKSRLSKAMLLQPDNINYICEYAKLINESDEADVAIGYLRNELKDRGDDIKILSQIAVLYYKSGQNKLYKKTKKKVEMLGLGDDTTIYRFLLQLSELEDDYKGVVKHARKIAILNPGDLANKLKLAQTLLFLKVYGQSNEILLEILKYMPSFKRANYYLGKLKYDQGAYAEAVAYGASESFYFPNDEFGFEIQGKATFELAQSEPEKSKRGILLSKAIRLLEKSISRNHNALVSLKFIGKIKYKQGLYDIAREYYLRAWDLNKVDPDTNKQLGYIFKQIGQGDMAIEYFQNYLELNKRASDKSTIEAEIRVLR